MTERITRDMLKKRGQMLTRVLGLPESGPGSLYIDRYAPGGNPYTQKLCQVGSTGGEIEFPENIRSTPRELFGKMTFAIHLIEKMNLGPQKIQELKWNQIYKLNPYQAWRISFNPPLSKEDYIVFGSYDEVSQAAKWLSSLLGDKYGYRIYQVDTLTQGVYRC